MGIFLRERRTGASDRYIHVGSRATSLGGERLEDFDPGGLGWFDFRDQSLFEQFIVAMHCVAGGCLAVIERAVSLADQFIHRKAFVEFGKADADGYLFRQLVFGEGVYYLKTLQEGHSVIELPDLGAIEGVVIQQATRRRADRKYYS